MDEYQLFTAIKDLISFQDYSLILPCVSVGNVPQLSIDLIINTLKLEHVGWLNDDCILPVIGNDALDYTGSLGHLHTAAEVYTSTEHKLAVLQLRSPVAKGKSSYFSQRLLEWCEKVGFCQVVVLSSIYAHERMDGQLTGSRFRFILNSKASDLNDHLTSDLGWTHMEPRDKDPSFPHEKETDSLFLPGSGIAKHIYKHSSSNVTSLKLILITMYCSQGDNIPDAVAMATHVDQWMNMVQTSYKGQFGVWIPPESWSSVYGSSHPRTLY